MRYKNLRFTYLLTYLHRMMYSLMLTWISGCSDLCRKWGQSLVMVNCHETHDMVGSPADHEHDCHNEDHGSDATYWSRASSTTLCCTGSTVTLTLTLTFMIIDHWLFRRRRSLVICRIQSINQFICRKEVSHTHDWNNVVHLIGKTCQAHKEHLQ